MSKVNSSWARPIQGISQQPPKTMKEGQCREQINMYPSPVRGLEKRAGSSHIARILDTLEPNAKVHHYSRGDNEEYFIVIEADGVPKVFGVDGVQHVVTVANAGDTYCAALNPKSTIAMQTIADYTFIVNKGTTVTLDAAVTAGAANEAIVYLQYATYGRSYKVIINGGTVAEYRTPSGSTATDIDLVDIDYIVGRLSFGTVWSPGCQVGAPVESVGEDVTSYWITLPAAAQVLFIYETVSGAVHTVGVGELTYTLNVLRMPASTAGKSITVIYEVPIAGGLSTLSGYEVVQYGASFHIKRTDGAAFTITTEDGAQCKDFVAISGSVTGIENLPPKAPEGYLIQIKGKGKKDDDAFYVKAVVSGSETKWVETLSPGMQYKFSPESMPRTLIRTGISSLGIATFALDYGAWSERDVGADDSNPWPSFKDRVIHSVGLFQNRLTFNSGEAVCMSRSGQFFNFFRESTQIVSADDPIDCYPDSPQVNILLHSVPLDGDMVFFSKNGQFLLPGSKPITKDTATLKQTNGFKMQTAVSPVPTGESILFAFDSGHYTGIRELFTDNIVDTKRARPVTEHVDRFIAGKLRCMVASTNQNLLLTLGDAGNVLYLYNWLWAGQEKLQSAWHSWLWPEGETIADMFFSQDKLYLLVARESGVYLEMIDLGDPNSEGLTFPARLDRQHTVVATRTGDRFSFPDSFPDELESRLEYVLSTGAYDEYKGTSVVFTRTAEGMYTDDDISGGDTVTLICGVKYDSTFIPSQPVVKDYKDRVIEIDTLRLAQVYLNYETTGYLRVTVQDIYGQCETNEFNGRVFGDVNNLVGFAPLIDGTFNFPVMQEADKVTIIITSDSFLPLRIRDMEYSGQYTQRGKRI